MQTESARRLRALLLPVLLAGAVGWLVGCGPPHGAGPPDVLLITVDTLRADYVHVYGFPQAITPSIDALAERGALFETAIAASSRTVPSHASIMTSRFVREHSVGTHNGSSSLAGHETLAERFRAAGYRTGAFVSNFVLKRRSGLDRGFDEYDDDLRSHEATRVGLSERVAEATATRARDWLAATRAASDGASRPVFLWAHFQDPHGPYRPPPLYQGRLDPVVLEPDPALPLLEGESGRMGIPHYQALPGMRRPSDYLTRYAEEIAYADHWIGELVRAFGEGGSRNTVILLTADHGESLGEAGYYFQHGQFASPEQTFVPFIVVSPGVPVGRYAAPVSHVDVAPTLLELAGLAPLAAGSGVSLVSLMRGGPPPAARVLFAETKRELFAYRGATQLRVRAGPPQPGSGTNENPIRLDADLRWRAFQRSEGRQLDLPLSSKEAAALEREVRAFLGHRAPVHSARPFSPEDVERLRALGYLSGD